jgi:hypothetical protein
MSLFDLLFLALVFTSAVVWAAAGVAAIRGRGSGALRILRMYGICFAGYMSLVAVSSLFWPRRVVNVGEPVCSDDWCIGVESVSRTPASGRVTFRVMLRLSSRALRVSQRERNAVVYLTDGQGRRYDARPDPSGVPFDTLLGPGESVAATRVFEAPASARDVNLVVTREGGFPIGWFIIGYETWFRKPTMVRLPA